MNYPVTLKHGTTTECAYRGIHTTSAAVIIRYDTGVTAADFARTRTTFERRGLKLGPITGLGDQAYYFASQVGHSTVTTVVIQNVRVLGMDLNANPSSDQPAVARTATLEVTAQDAVKLALAGQAGTLSLALRRIGADQVEPVRPMLVKDLGAFDSSPAAPIGLRPHVGTGPKHAPGAPAASGTVTVVEGATRASVAVPTEHFGLGSL